MTKEYWLEKVSVSFLIAVVLMSFLSTTCLASPEVKLTKGQTVYAPAYSHVFVGDRPLPFNLAVTLNVRNTDPTHEITVHLINYFDSDGRLLKNFLTAPIRLKPMASKSIFLKETDTSGGLAPSFIVKWTSEKEVNAPLIETVMIGARKGQGISFVSVGLEVKETAR